MPPRELTKIRISPIYITQIKEPTEEQCQEAVRIDGSILRYIPNPSVEVYRIVINQFPKEMVFVDDKDSQLYTKFVKRNIEFVIAHPDIAKPVLTRAIVDDPTIYTRLPEEHCTPELATELVNKDWKFLQYVKKQTAALCREALDQSDLAFIYIDPSLQPEFISEVGPSLPCMLSKIKRQTDAVCLRAVEESPGAIRDCSNPSLEVCSYVLKKSLCYLQYNQHPNMLAAAQLILKENGKLIKQVPSKFLSAAMCAEAVCNDPSITPYIPDQYRSIIGNLVKLRTEPHLINQMNPDTEFYIAAIKVNRKVIPYIPDRRRIDKYIRYAIQGRYMTTDDRNTNLRDLLPYNIMMVRLDPTLRTEYPTRVDEECCVCNGEGHTLACCRNVLCRECALSLKSNDCPVCRSIYPKW